MYFMNLNNTENANFRTVLHKASVRENREGEKKNRKKREKKPRNAGITLDDLSLKKTIP